MKSSHIQPCLYTQGTNTDLCVLSYSQCFYVYFMGYFKPYFVVQLSFHLFLYEETITTLC